MYPNKKKYRNRTIITEEMANSFIRMIRETLKNSVCLLTPPESTKIDCFLPLRTSDGTVYGCTDGTCFVLDSVFFHNRFCRYWYMKELNWNPLFAMEEIPNQSDFYTKLYHKNVLSHNGFFQKPTMKFQIISDEEPRLYFCIDAEQLGIYDEIVLKPSF